VLKVRGSARGMPLPHHLCVVQYFMYPVRYAVQSVLQERLTKLSLEGGVLTPVTGRMSDWWVHQSVTAGVSVVVGTAVTLGMPSWGHTSDGVCQRVWVADSDLGTPHARRRTPMSPSQYIPVSLCHCYCINV